MNRSSELAWKQRISLIKRNISYLWKRKLILSTTFGGDMLIPRKNILICNLQNQKFQMIWFRRTFQCFCFWIFHPEKGFVSAPIEGLRIEWRHQDPQANGCYHGVPLRNGWPSSQQEDYCGGSTCSTQLKKWVKVKVEKGSISTQGEHDKRWHVYNPSPLGHRVLLR